MAREWIEKRIAGRPCGRLAIACFVLDDFTVTVRRCTCYMGCILLSVVSTVSVDFLIGTILTLSDFSSLLPLCEVV